jgi:hypothetical protein
MRAVLCLRLFAVLLVLISLSGRYKNIYMDRHFKRIINRSFVSDENIKNEILGFELNNITENQDGVDEATGKFTQISHKYF